MTITAPCYNLVTTLIQQCYNLATAWLQRCYNIYIRRLGVTYDSLNVVERFAGSVVCLQNHHL